MIIKYLTFSLLVCAANASHAAEHITGAFGLNLGDKYLGQTFENPMFSFPLPIHKIEPESPVSLLDRYFILKTRDNRVAAIMGAGSGQCTHEYSVLVEALLGKYKDLNVEDLSQGERYQTDFFSNSSSRYIRVICEGTWMTDLYFSKQIVVLYVDDDLYQLVESEQREQLNGDAL
jgi:hypothetical protein